MPNTFNKQSYLAEILNKTKEYLFDLALDSRRLMFTFGLVLFINFPIFYVVWVSTLSNDFDSLPLRVVASVLCIPLIFNKYWPEKKLHFLVLYWYMVACYCLPFFFTFMLLKNNTSTLWLMNTVSAVFFIMLVFDAFTSIILLMIGAFLGIFVFKLTTSYDDIFHIPGTVSVETIAATFAAVIIIGGIFSRSKQVVENIKRRSIKAEANSRAKSEFIANMSHDIRTPITGMLGLVQDMLNKAEEIKSSDSSGKSLIDLQCLLNDTTTTMKRNSEYLMVATDELLQLCNEILEVTRLESHGAAESEESFNIRELIQHNIDLLLPVAEHKKIVLTANINSSVPDFLLGIRLYLDRVILNIVSNALKFTKAGTVKITVDLVEVSDKEFSKGDNVNLIFIIEDTGIGIPEEKFDTIFEHFSRLTPAFEGIYKGAGLGLYTVNRYVIAMDGEIHVESEVGKGSRFTINIPFIVSDKTDVSITPRIPRQKFQMANIASPIQESLVQDTTTEKPFSVLVVEDNSPARMAITIQLRPFKCNVDTAEDGTQAVEKAKSGNYHLILMDIGLPDFSGIEATKQIRALQDKQRSNVPIVALTGHANDPEKRQEAFAAGMQEVLSKPAQPLILESIFQRFVFSPTVDETENCVDAKSLPVIDWDVCLHMCIDDVSFTHKMLTMLCDDLIKTKAKLASAYSNKDTQELRSLLHYTRGAVCYLKVPQLEQALKAFHKAVKAIPQEHVELDRLYMDLQQAIDAYQAEWVLKYKDN